MFFLMLSALAHIYSVILQPTTHRPVMARNSIDLHFEYSEDEDDSMDENMDEDAQRLPEDSDGWNSDGWVPLEGQPIPPYDDDDETETPPSEEEQDKHSNEPSELPDVSTIANLPLKGDGSPERPIEVEYFKEAKELKELKELKEKLHSLLKHINILEPHIQCPLTLNVMEHPVVGSDGQTYERRAIERWCEEKKTSPITRQPGFYVVGTNLTVKWMVDEYHEKRQDYLRLFN